MMVEFTSPIASSPLSYHHCIFESWPSESNKFTYCLEYLTCAVLGSATKLVAQCLTVSA
jgi:hypothetical protein